MSRIDVLKNVFAERYHKIFEADRFINEFQLKDYRDNLLFELTEDQKTSLKNSTGSAFEEIAKINSSTALGINVYSLLQNDKEDINGLIFEHQVGRPLSKGYPSNLDVYYTKEGVIHFVECKFLEPYYMESIKSIQGLSSYFDIQKYQTISREHAVDWVNLFQKFSDMISEGEIVYYDIIQMLKHVLSIYNFHLKSQSSNVITLENACWSMDQSFFDNLGSDEERAVFKKIQDKHYTEAQICIVILNDFIRHSLCVNSFSVVYCHYEDLLNELQPSPLLDSLSTRYFLFGK